MKDSGTYTFKKDDLFQQAAELTKPNKIWEAVYNGSYFDIKQTNTPLSAIAVFHKDENDPTDCRPYSKAEAEVICGILVAALNDVAKV